MHFPDNEGKACDAIVRLLEMRTGETRANNRHPQKDCVGTPVDLHLTLGVRGYTMAHAG